MPSFYITGCDSGFGRDLVSRLYEKGHQVFAGCLLKQSVDDIEKEFPPGQGKGRVVAILLDVTDEASVHKAAETIKGLTDRLDGLVNNAGILIDAGPAEWSSTASFRKMLEVNVIGMSSVMKSVVDLIRQAQGRIVNVASIVGHFSFPYLGTYGATKYAVEGYSDSIRQDLHPWGVTVHVVEPGIFPMTGLYSGGAVFQDGITGRYAELPRETQEVYGEAYLKSVTEALTEGCMASCPTRTDSEYPRPWNTHCSALLPSIVIEWAWTAERCTFMSFLPEWVRDMVNEFLQNWVFRVEAVPPVSAPKDGLSMAKSRYAAPTKLIFIILATGLVVLVIGGGGWAANPARYSDRPRTPIAVLCNIVCHRCAPEDDTPTSKQLRVSCI
ncbi:Dehydrogenase [Perkinsus olseni]|uniref:Dehydrogenase n=1 Tax=Perkinsus olseni TaxID=32597 RepID=A0A7J6N262_PEROL|nr:Dehydrogenase [Perkinsus olseni]